MSYPMFNNDFTRKEESDKIKSNNSYPTLSNQMPKLSSEQQKNINSAYKAKQGGFITASQYKSNLAKNGVKTWEEKTPEFKPPKTNLNQTGITKINTTKVKIPNEKLEQERLRDLTGQWDLKKVKEDELDNHIRLKNKRPDDYYREIVDDKEQQKRLDEAFGAKTNFSLSNYENNYDKFNQEEKEMFTHKMQVYLNKKGYTGKDGYHLKYDGILGPNTKKALEDYKKDNYNDYKEAVELKEINSSDLRKMYDELVLKDANGKPIILASTNHSLGGQTVASSNKGSFKEKWGAVKYAGVVDTVKIKNAADKASEESKKYKDEKGIKGTEDNEVDAYRHFSWNYNTIRSGVKNKDAEQVITNHESLTQIYMGHDEYGNGYNKITLASLMDLVNNQIGRYQASLERNKDKSDREVFDYLVSRGMVITSLEQVLTLFNIDKKWLYNSEEGITNKTSVLIRGNIKADPFEIEIVDKNNVKLNNLGIFQRTLYI